MDDDFEPKSSQGHKIGQPLETMGVEELYRYKQQLLAEIARVDSEVERKTSVRAAAEQLFKPRG